MVFVFILRDGAIRRKLLMVYAAVAKNTAHRFTELAKPLQRLIEELHSGHVDPMYADFLVLDVSNVSGKLMSISN